MLQQVQCELRRSEASGNVLPNVQPGLRQLDRQTQPTTCSNNTITPSLVNGVPLGNPLFGQSKGTYSGVLDRAENSRVKVTFETCHTFHNYSFAHQHTNAKASHIEHLRNEMVFYTALLRSSDIY